MPQAHFRAMAASTDCLKSRQQVGLPTSIRFVSTAQSLNFYLRRSRTTVGINIAPSSTVIFKLNYLFNHTFGPVPTVPGGVGGALFGVSLLPHLGYGRNGFTGSIAPGLCAH